MSINLGNGVSFIQSAAVNVVVSGTTQNIVFSSNNSAGNLIVVTVFSKQITQTPTIFDSQGNTYPTADTSLTAFATWEALIFHAANIKAGANTVTIGNLVNGQILFAVIHEFSGLATTSVFDKGAGTAGTTNGTISSGNTAITTSAKEMVFGWGFINTGGTLSPGAGFTGLYTDGAFVQTEAQTVTSTGAQAAIETLTGSGAAGWSLQVATYVIALVPPTPTAWSPIDCRISKPNNATFRTVNGAQIDDVQTSSNPAVPGTDSRKAGTPVACGIYPQNSRVAPPFHG